MDLPFYRRNLSPHSPLIYLIFKLLLYQFGMTRFDEARSVVAFGEMFFQFQFPLAGGKTILTISDENANIFKYFTGMTGCILAPKLSII